MEVEEAWATYFEHVKGKVDLQKLWKLAQNEEVEIDMVENFSSPL